MSNLNSGERQKERSAQLSKEQKIGNAMLTKVSSAGNGIKNKLESKGIKVQAISRFVNMEKRIKEAREFVLDVGGRHDIPNSIEVPEDLRDTNGDWRHTREGFSIHSKVLQRDLNIGSSSPILPFFAIGWMILVATMSFTGIVGKLLALTYMIAMAQVFSGFSVVVSAIFIIAPTALLSTFSAYTGIIDQLLRQFLPFDISLSTVFALIPVFIPYIAWRNLTSARRTELLANSIKWAADVLTAPGRNSARWEQAGNAHKDKTSFVKIGEGKGVFSKEGDRFAPDPGIPFGLTIADMSKHVLWLGSTGTGKTSGGLRPTILGVVHDEEHTKMKNGMLVLDGKSQLAMDCKKLLDIVIHPSTLKNLNVLEGINPEIFARTLQLINTKGQESGNGAYFNGQARNLIFYASVIHEALIELGNAKNNLSTRLRLISDMCKPVSGDSKLIDDIKFHKDFPTEGTLLHDSVKKYMELQYLADETKSGIFSTAESWIIPLLQSKTLRDWAEVETSDIDFAKILEGAKFGFCLPESEFGIAGVAITSLMKARLYNLIQLRGDKREGQDHSKRSKVFLVIDEAQRVIDDSDLAILPVARSLDLVCIFATQNVDSIIQKFGNDGAQVILDSFRSIISYKSSEKTMELMSQRIGKVKRKIIKGIRSDVDMASTNSISLGLGYFDTSNENYSVLKRKAEKLNEQSNVWKLFKFDTLFNRISASSDSRGHTEALSNRTTVRFEYSPEAHAIFGGIEMQELNTPFTAVACIERGNVPRRDIIRTLPLNNDFISIYNTGLIPKPMSKKEQEELDSKPMDELVKKYFG